MSDGQNKKATLLEIIHNLFWVFDLAEELYKYIKNSNLNDETVKNLTELFLNEINIASQEKSQSFITETLNKLRIMHQKEMMERKQEQEDVLNLIL